MTRRPRVGGIGLRMAWRTERHQAVEIERSSPRSRVVKRSQRARTSSDRQNFTDRRQGSPTETPAKSLPLSSLSNSFRRLGNLTLRKDCGAWLTLRFDGDVAMA